jgi:signal transduction histidine kinase
VAINVRAAGAARRARKGGAADGTGALDEIASVSAEALDELRTTLKALRSAQDGPAPLRPVQDLASLIAGVEEAGLSVQLEMAGTAADLPPAVGHAGYRIVQEGLTNVLRHSTARQALVRVEAGHGSVLIEVHDEGRPQTPAQHAVGHAAGHGLAGMRERAAALGGSCEAGPAGGTGWRVRAEIPIAGARG